MAIPRSYTLGLVFGAFGLALVTAMPPAAGDTVPLPDVSLDEIDSERLERFAKASLRVEAIRDEWSDQVEATADPAEIRELHEAQEAAIVEAVEAEGLTIEEYDALFTLVETNEVFAAEVLRLQRSHEED
ncbi:MAG: DUF4168 domain-containing protein [Geminicoccaceae bacterium]|nr:MAG: DUF4168 domain-containing protein [Geminicoccaceae bacterium]